MKVRLTELFLFCYHSLNDEYRKKAHTLSSHLLDFFKVYKIEDCQKIEFQRLYVDKVAITVLITRSSSETCLTITSDDIPFLIDKAILHSKDPEFTKHLRRKKLAIELDI